MSREQLKAAEKMAAAYPHIWRRLADGWNYYDAQGVQWCTCKNGNPFDDLNAIYEMEKVMDQQQAKVFAAVISDVSTESDLWVDLHIWHAGAPVRATALIAAFRSKYALERDVVIVDITYIAAWQRYHSGDSREDAGTFIKWADEFMRFHEDTDWLTHESSYVEEVEAFAKEKLHEMGGLVGGG